MLALFSRLHSLPFLNSLEAPLPTRFVALTKKAPLRGQIDLALRLSDGLAIPVDCMFCLGAAVGRQPPRVIGQFRTLRSQTPRLPQGGRRETVASV